jgi:diguanylate cyclase (GGDEF)-like protein
MSAAWHDRRIVFALAASVYGGVFAAFIVAETPGLGLGHFFYVPICMIALASDQVRGAAAGVVATGVYALAVTVSPNVPTGSFLTSSTLIRLTTYCGIGALVGWYASRNRRLVAQLRSHAFEDFLTGIGNARMFDEDMAKRCALELPFTLVLADLDDFGQINNAHGHEAGNTALRTVAGAFRSAVGATDVIARIGGDEFALLTSRPVEEAALLCHRIGRAAEAEGLHLSFGTTSRPNDGTTAVELFRKADDRLFAAKLLNRNRRTVALGS